MKPSIDGPEISSESRLASLIAAAGDATRLRILSLVLSQPRSVSEICQALHSAQPRVSHHLAILRRSGLLEVEVRGRRRFYRWPKEGTQGPVEDLAHFLREHLGAPTSDPADSEVAVRPPSPSTELEDFLL